MSDFEKALEITLRVEGGYVNDPADRGGATNFGVTQETYDKFCRNHSMPTRPVREITEAEVVKIYRGYWDAVDADSLEWPLNAVLFDMAVNHGPVSAKKLLQRTLGLDEDGQIGPQTRIAMAKFDTDSLTNNLLWTRVDRYRALSKGDQIKFLPGWLYRVKHLREETGLMAMLPAEYTD